MTLQIEGRVKEITEPVTGESARGPWIKRYLIISTIEQFPKDVALVAWNDNAKALDQLKVGSRVLVKFAVESRNYQGRWYTDAKIVQIKLVKEEPITPNEPVSQKFDDPRINEVYYNYPRVIKTKNENDSDEIPEFDEQDLDDETFDTSFNPLDDEIDENSDDSDITFNSEDTDDDLSNDDNDDLPF